MGWEDMSSENVREPTNGELALRIDHYNEARSSSEAALVQSIESLRTEVRSERQEAARTYVRKDNNERDLREIRDDVKELKSHWTTQQDRNRQIIIGIVIGFALMVAGIISNATGFTTGSH